jgi:hypothetical protein
VCKAGGSCPGGLDKFLEHEKLSLTAFVQRLEPWGLPNVPSLINSYKAVLSTTKKRKRFSQKTVNNNTNTKQTQHKQHNQTIVATTQQHNNKQQ